MSQIQGAKLSNFREWVAGDRVLDGDLVANKDGSLSKVNYGGTFKRWFLKLFNLARTSGEAESAAVRDSFYNALKAHVDGVQGLDEDKKTTLLKRLEHELCAPAFKNVPLSRRTVRMCIDAVDRETAGGVNKSGDKALPKDAVEVEGLLGKFTLTKTQYKAMFDQVLLYLENKDGDEKISPEKLKAIKGQIKGYLNAFDGYAGKKGANLGNLGVFFMGSMDLESVKNKMIKFFDNGVLPTRANKKVKSGTVLSPELQKELRDLENHRMNEGDVELSKLVNVASLHPANMQDVEQAEKAAGSQELVQKKSTANSLPPQARLVADLVFCENLLETEEYQFGDGERIVQMMSKNFDAFKLVCLAVAAADREAAKVEGADPRATAREKIVNTEFFKYMRLVLAKSGDNMGEKGAVLVDRFVDFFRAVNNEVFGGSPTVETFDKATLYEKCETLYDLAEKRNLDTAIDDALKESAEGFAKDVVEALKKNFDLSSQEGAEDESFEEKLKRDNNNLLLEVLPLYIKDGNPNMLRRMFASSIRQADPQDLAVSVDGKEDNAAKHHIDYGAFLMGAGPYLHKLLQGLQTSAKGEGLTDEETHIMEQIDRGVKNIKSKLPGLDFDTVYAHLLALLRPNDGENGGKPPFDSIKITKLCGAASVGVTYLCDINYKSADKSADRTVKNVVFKMLRPGIQQQLQEEADLFKKAAEQVGLGHEVDVSLSSMKREFDLSDELKSLKKGAEIYGKDKMGEKITSQFVLSNGEKLEVSADDQVDSVLPEEDIPATKNCMVMKCAKGVEVSQAIGEVRKDINEIISEQDSGSSLEDVISKVDKKRIELDKLHGALLQVSAKLVKGLCGTGKGGFFHGDLHGGNMMFDKTSGRITLIDYGKGTELSEVQTRVFRRLLLIASYGEGLRGPFVANAFIEAYEDLMKAERGDEFALKTDMRNRLLKEFDKLWSKSEGVTNGIGIIGCFGMAAKKAGADIPVALYDFFETCRKLGNEISQVETLQAQLNDFCSGNDLVAAKCEKLVDTCIDVFKGSDLFYNDHSKSEGMESYNEEIDKKNQEVLDWFGEVDFDVPWSSESFDELRIENKFDKVENGLYHAPELKKADDSFKLILGIEKPKEIKIGDKTCFYYPDLVQNAYSLSTYDHASYVRKQFKYLIWCVKQCQVLMKQTNFDIKLGDPVTQKLISRLKGSISFMRLVMQKTGFSEAKLKDYLANEKTLVSYLKTHENEKPYRNYEAEILCTKQAIEGTRQLIKLLDAADDMVRGFDDLRDKTKPPLRINGNRYAGNLDGTIDRHLYLYGYNERFVKSYSGKTCPFDLSGDSYAYASGWKANEDPIDWLKDPEENRLKGGALKEYGELYGFVKENFGASHLEDLTKPDGSPKLDDLFTLQKRAKELGSVVKCSATMMMQSQIGAFFMQERERVGKGEGTGQFDLILNKVGQSLSDEEFTALAELKKDFFDADTPEEKDGCSAKYDALKEKLKENSHDFSVEMNLFESEVLREVEYAIRRRYLGEDEDGNMAEGVVGVDLSDEAVKEKVDNLIEQIKASEEFKHYSETDAYRKADEPKRNFLLNLFLAAHVRSTDYWKKVKTELTR